MSKVTIVKSSFSSLINDIPIVIDDSVPTHHLIFRTDTHDLTINFRTGKTSKQKRVKFEPLPRYGSHMTWADFCECVASSGFMDDDGSGTLATATELSNMPISPSRITFAKVDDDEQPPTPPQPFPWATHVHWCNK
jgi:hypothetical protein